MNILANHSGKLNEIIFKNRNKAYGAYAIRESYNSSVIKSLLFLSSLILFIFGTLAIYNKTNNRDADDKIIILNDPKFEPMEYMTKVDVTPVSELLQNNAAAVAPKGAVATVIRNNAIETSTTNINYTINGVGSNTATGNSSIGTETTTVNTNSVVISHSVAINEPVNIAEEMPEFEGGYAGLMKYLSQNIVYPERAKEIGQGGTVYVTFVVNEVGDVENVKILKGVGFGCDEEVARVFSKMPRWKKVGKNGGHPVKVKHNMPVSFKLK